MTYNNTSGVTEFRVCLCIGHYNTTHVVCVCYIQLPNNVSLLNEFMCGSLNREGPLCGRIKMVAQEFLVNMLSCETQHQRGALSHS